MVTHIIYWPCAVTVTNNKVCVCILTLIKFCRVIITIEDGNGLTHNGLIVCPTWLPVYSDKMAEICLTVDSSWNVMAHGDAREGKWRGNWRMEWVANTLHTTSEHGVSSITTADAHTSAASSRLNWRHRRFKWTRPFRPKDEICFLRGCHHISNAVYNEVFPCSLSCSSGYSAYCISQHIWAPDILFSEYQGLIWGAMIA